MNGGKIINCLFLMISFGLLSCNPDPPEPDDNGNNQNKPQIREGQVAFVINEGNFQWGNASLSRIDLKTSKVENEVFQSANGRKIGDVFHSLYLHEEKAWAVINNSGKIEVFDPESLESLSTIDGLLSPRQLAFSNDKIYVSNFTLQGETELNIISKNDYVKLNSIPFKGWIEELEIVGDELFILSRGEDRMYIMSLVNENIIDTVEFDEGEVQGMVKNDNEHLIVSVYYQSSTRLYFKLFKGTDFLSERAMNSSLALQQMRLNQSKDRLIFISDRVYEIDASLNQWPPQGLIDRNGRQLYGLGISPFDQTLWLSDAYDYNRSGTIYHYSQSGAELIDSFTVGRIPQNVIFYESD